MRELIKKNKIPISHMLTIGILPNFLKKWIYRFKGYIIGKGVSIGIGSIIIGEEVNINEHTKIGIFTVVRAKNISIGKLVKIGSLTFIDTEKLVIEDDARINEQVIIGGIKNCDSCLKLGKRTIIMEYSFINPTKPIIIGDDTGIGGHCLLFTHGSWLSQLDGYPVTFKPIEIGKNVWLPWRVFIMPGVTIGDNVVIGADSLVRNSLPSNCLAAGSPAKIIRRDYPPALSNEKRSRVLSNIFSDFIKYMEHNGYVCIKEKVNNGFKITLSSKSKKYYIYYCTAKYNVFTNKKDDILMVHDYYEDDFEMKSSYNRVMKINLQIKKRSGTSKVGEEFVKYISRYGIRFERIISD